MCLSFSQGNLSNDACRFYEAWETMRLEVQVLVVAAWSHCPFCGNVVTTGHSLGAALSTLAAVDLINTFPNCSVSV